jgi:hypothetical protein
MEEITSFFHYGIGKSIEDNVISKRGYPSSVQFDGSPSSFRLIMGLVPIGKKFKGVQDIRKKGAGTIEIIGTGGERIEVPCSIDFLL